MIAVEPQTESAVSISPSAREASIDVSIVIVSWNSARWIRRCVEALPAAAGKLRWEAIVWDNGSADHSAAIAARGADERVEVVASPSNRGFAGAINDLIPRLRGRYVFLLNPDCAPTPGSIEVLARALDAPRSRRDGRVEPIVGAIPILVGERGETQREFQLRRFPTVGSILADTLLLEQVLPSNRASRVYRYRDLDITTEQTVQQPAAAALMLRRDVMLEVGAFDERFLPAWFEDVDYCRRIWERGGRLKLIPDAKVVHFGGSSLEVLGYEEFLSLWYRNLHRYAEKWMSGGEVEAIRWGIVAGMAIRILAATVGVTRAPLTPAAAKRAYRRVLSEAWRRWRAKSQSS